MTPERWRQIDRLFHLALECDTAQRDAFLKQACEGDESLRREVVSLLGSHDKANSFIRTPAEDIAAELIAGRETQLTRGQYIGHYQILSLLGEGGMGEVYLAHDIRLGRHVALKRLPAKFTLDADRVYRFKQEARAVSALNHPNIVTIHEVGRSNSSHFITTEFIEGETLRQHLAKGPMTLDEALDVATQIASALTAAHAAGIVHRDIKPENIMIRPDGYVKVLDFGLAKLADAKQESVLDLKEFAGGQNQTGRGLILGTVNYMSPEQAKGEMIDERTDIFSFGIVIYEILSGLTPFAGASTPETLANLINAEPQPLSTVAPNVPNELQKIVSQTLCKNKDQRYQTMNVLSADLRALRQNSKWNNDWKESRSVNDDSATVVQTTVSARKLTTETRLSFFQQINQHKLFASVLAALLLGTIGAAFYFLKRNKLPLDFQAGQIKRLTSTGRVRAGVVSPNGKFVIYAQEENAGQQSLWMRDIGSESNVQIVPSSDIEYQVLNITPDGNSIYFLDGVRSVYQIPVTGGKPKKIAEDLLRDSRIGFSPDGKQFTFVRRLEKNLSALFIIDADGTNERKLKSFEQPTRLGDDPAWSPDGKIIACPVLIDGFFKILAIRLADEQATFISKDWSVIRRLAWLPDSNSLVFIGTVKGNIHQLFRISYPGGEARQIYSDLYDYIDLSLTSDGRSLAAVKVEEAAHLWTSSSSDVTQTRQITSGFEKFDGIYSLEWLSASKILYTSSPSDGVSTWTIEADGSNPNQLIKDGHYPTLSPDRRFIVFRERIGNEVALLRLDLSDGSKKLVTKGIIHYPTFSPDGKWLVFTKYNDGMALWKVPIEGGEPTRLLVENALCSAVSPDGKTIAFVLRRGGNSNRIALVSFDGGEIIKIFAAVPETNPLSNNQNLEWTPDGRAIYYIALNSGVSNILRQPIDGSPPIQVTQFATGRIFNFSYSPDGQQLAMSRGVLDSDVVLIKDFE